MWLYEENSLPEGLQWVCTTGRAGYSRDCSIPILLNILYKEITQNQLDGTWMFKRKINSVLPCYSVWNNTRIVQLNLLKYNCALLQSLPWPLILLVLWQSDPGDNSVLRPSVSVRQMTPKRGPCRKLVTSRTQTINHESIFGRVLAPLDCVINELALVRLTEILTALKH